MRLFMPHSKCHEKTISFFVAVKAHGSINSYCSHIELDKVVFGQKRKTFDLP